MSAANRPTVLVTGATRGIGRAVADLLAPDHDLIVGGRSAAEVSAVCGRLPSARPFVADLADEDAVGGAVEELGGLDRLDGLVHSAGVLGSGALTDLRRAGWRQTLETNVVAVADLTRLLLQPLVAAQGTVVVVNSGSGLRAHGRAAPTQHRSSRCGRSRTRCARNCARGACVCRPSTPVVPPPTCSVSCGRSSVVSMTRRATYGPKPSRAQCDSCSRRPRRPAWRIYRSVLADTISPARSWSGGWRPPG